MSCPYKVGAPEEKVTVSVSTSGGCLAKETKDESFFRSHSVYAKCTSCSSTAPTHVNQNCSLLNCLFGYYCGSYWFIYSSLKNKDLNCKNAEHKCASCGTTLANYSAC